MPKHYKKSGTCDTVAYAKTKSGRQMDPNMTNAVNEGVTSTNTNKYG